MSRLSEKLLEMEVGRVEFDGRSLPVYRDLNDPLFLGSDVLEMIGWNRGPSNSIQYYCEIDEMINMFNGIPGPFITETGLYNVLSTTTNHISRKWRRVIHNEIVRARKQRGFDIIAKFDEWDHELDTLYIDEETGILMQSVTVAGGDVEQVVYEG